MQGTSTSHTYHLTTRHRQVHRFVYVAPLGELYSGSNRQALQKPSTDQPCVRDMCNTPRSFTHKSNTCVIGRLAFLILGFIDLLSCTSSLPPSTTWHQRILVCPRTSKSWDCSERSRGFPNDCAVVRRLGNWGCSKKSTENKWVNRSLDKQSESVNVRPNRVVRARFTAFPPVPMNHVKIFKGQPR